MRRGRSESVEALEANRIPDRRRLAFQVEAVIALLVVTCPSW